MLNIIYDLDAAFPQKHLYGRAFFGGAIVIRAIQSKFSLKLS
jgi:hypothetical protein